MRSEMKKNAWAAEGMIVLAAALWGCTGFFVRRLSALGHTQIQIVFLRVIFALAGMAVLLLFRDRRLFRVRLRDLWCFFGTGVVSLLFFNVCYFQAMQLTTLSVAAVLLYTAPCFVMLLSAPLFRERITANKLAALVLMLGGCALVTGILDGNARATLGGVLFGLGSGIGYALYSIFGRYALNRGYDPYTISFYTFAFAAAGCLPFAGLPQLAVSLTPSAWLYSAGIGLICCTLPYVFYTKGLKWVENGRASLLATMEPLVATLISVLAFGERFTWFNACGIVLMIVSVLVMNGSTRRSETA